MKKRSKILKQLQDYKAAVGNTLYNLRLASRNPTGYSKSFIEVNKKYLSLNLRLLNSFRREHPEIVDTQCKQMKLLLS